MMKTLNQKGLEQVAGGYHQSNSRKNWKGSREEVDKGFSKAGDNISDVWRKAWDAVHGN